MNASAKRNSKPVKQLKARAVLVVTTKAAAVAAASVARADVAQPMKVKTTAVTAAEERGVGR